MSADDADRLRARLIELRADALRQLCAGLPVVDTGMLRLVADASTVLAAIEDEEKSEGRTQ